MARMGYIIKLGGDPEISAALAAGVRATSEDRARVVRDEIIRQRSEAAVRRVAMQRHTSEELAAMIVKARYDYGQDPEPCRLSRRLLGLYGLLVYGLARAYRVQDRVLRGGSGR